MIKTAVQLCFIVLCAMSSFAQDWEGIITSSCNDLNFGEAVKVHNQKVYFTGTYQGNMNIGFNSISGIAHNDIFIGKGSIGGNTEWLRAINGTMIDQASTINVINDTILVSGIFSDSLFVGNDTLATNYQRAPFIAYYDTLGNYIKSFVPDAYNTEIKEILQDQNGDLIFIGDFFQFFNYGTFSMSSISGINFFLMKYDPWNDEVVWGVHAHDNSSEGSSIAIGPNNDIYAIGLYNSGTTFIDTTITTSNVNHNFFVSKFNTNGVKEWVRTIEGDEEVHGFGIAVDDSSNVFVVGEFEGDISIDGNQHSSNGFYDIILTKYDTDGNHVWSKSMGDTDSDEGYDVELDANQDPVVLAEAGTNLIVDGTPINTSGWNEPLVMKFNNGTGDLVWYNRVESTVTSGLVTASDLSIEGEYISVTGANRSSILLNANTYAANNMNDFYCITMKDSLTYYLGLEENYSKGDQAQIVLYPNPANNFISFRGINDRAEVKIFDLYGQLLENHTVYTDEDLLNVSHLATGSYVIIINYNNAVSTRKLIKQ